MFVIGITHLSDGGSDCVASFGRKMYEMERVFTF